jgi:hypothetical protein
VIASLIETCKLIGVEPYAYLADVITRIIDGHPNSRLDELLPWANPATPDIKAVAWERRFHRIGDGGRIGFDRAQVAEGFPSLRLAAGRFIELAHDAKRRLLHRANF